MKGKKRARADQPTLSDSASRDKSSSLSPLPDEDLDPSAKAKRSKRAKTEICPVCEEKIPVRLLEIHYDLERRRVDEILSGVGMPVVEDFEAGPSTIRRGAAAKARKSLIRKGGPEMSAVEETERTIKLIQRHRKKRHAKLKELIMQDDDERLEVTMTGNETICPVCLSTVRGDQDIIEAHVDACIANESRLLAEAEQRERQEQDRRINVETWGEVDVNGETRARLTDVQGLRGMGFHIHDRTQEDAEEYIDVDGDDEVKYGQIQFTEQDLLDATFAVGSVTARREEEGGEDVGKALRDLVAEGKVVTKGAAESKNNTRVGPDMVESIEDIHRIDHAIALARKNRDHNLLISALESKIKQLETVHVSSATSSQCRICLDHYVEPTVSTGCWHICCKDCWLRCLGSTKLCPGCKRITSATDLRRVYL